MAIFHTIQEVSMTGATTAINQYTQVVRIVGTNGSGNTFTLPQVGASNSIIGYDYNIVIVDTSSYISSSTPITIQRNASDTSVSVNGGTQWVNYEDNKVIKIS